MSLNDYDGAISILMQIDPACQCAKESEKLMKSIQQEIDNTIAYERKMKLYQMQQNADLKKQRNSSYYKKLQKALILIGNRLLVIIN